MKKGLLILVVLVVGGFAALQVTNMASQKWRAHESKMRYALHLAQAETEYRDSNGRFTASLGNLSSYQPVPDVMIGIQSASAREVTARATHARLYRVCTMKLVAGTTGDPEITCDGKTGLRENSAPATPAATARPSGVIIKGRVGAQLDSIKARSAERERRAAEMQP